MTLHFTNPITFANGKKADLSKPVGDERYGPGFQSGNPLGHSGGGGGPVGVPEVSRETLNQLIAAGDLEDGAWAVLEPLGGNGQITEDDMENLYYLRYGGSTYLDAIATVRGYRARLAKAAADQAGEGGGNPEDRPPEQRYEGAFTNAEAEAELKAFGLITSATDWGGKLGRKWYIERVYQNKLTAANIDAWMWENHKRKRLPEQIVPRRNFVALFDAMEKAIAEWGLATAENAADLSAKQDAAKAAYFAWEKSFIPEEGETLAVPSFGDRVVNPRSLIYEGRDIENAIVLGSPTSAAVSGPGVAVYLGAPQHLSRFEAYGMHQSAAPLQADEWRYLLGLKPAGGSGDGLSIGGVRS